MQRTKTNLFVKSVWKSRKLTNCKLFGQLKRSTKCINLQKNLHPKNLYSMIKVVIQKRSYDLYILWHGTKNTKLWFDYDCCANEIVYRQTDYPTKDLERNPWKGSNKYELCVLPNGGFDFLKTELSDLWGWVFYIL